MGFYALAYAVLLVAPVAALFWWLHRRPDSPPMSPVDREIMRLAALLDSSDDKDNVT